MKRLSGGYYVRFVIQTTLENDFEIGLNSARFAMLKLYDASNVWCLVNKQIKDFLEIMCLVLEAQK